MRADESARGSATIPRKPLLKPWYRLAVDEDRATLRYGASVLEFTGRASVALLPHLLPLLDGTRTIEAIGAELGEPVRPALEHALALLARERLLTEPAPATSHPHVDRTVELLAATDRYDVSPATVLRRLGETRAAVVGSSGVAHTVAALLRRSGVRHVAQAEWCDGAAHETGLTIVAPSEEEIVRVPRWNVDALESGTRWLQVLPYDGAIAAVGPLYVPYESACHRCYRLRRDANVSPVPDTSSGRRPAAPALDAVVAGLAAMTALRYLALEDGLTIGVLLAVDANELSCSRHVLYRVPRCPACSPAATEAAPSPWYGVESAAA